MRDKQLRNTQHQNSIWIVIIILIPGLVSSALFSTNLIVGDYGNFYVPEHVAYGSHEQAIQRSQNYAAHLAIPVREGTLKRQVHDVSYTFVLHNTGTEDLLIYEVTTPCDFLSLSLTSHVVPAGQTALLIVRLDPAQYHGTYDTIFHRSITVETNSWPQSTETLWVRGIVNDPASR